MKTLSILSWVLLVLCGTVLLLWNASALIGAPPKPRMKDLTFAPSAEVMRLLSLGHENTVAKLRWIDSFSYLQYQFEKRDDTLLGNAEQGGFERLYGALIELDPHFLPFYDFAITAESVLEKGGGLAMRSIQRGLLQMPHSMHLWRNFAAHFKFMSHDKVPEILDQILGHWLRFAPSEKDKYAIDMWRRKIGENYLQDLGQLDYWCDRLVRNKRGSTLSVLAEQTLRKQLATYALHVFAQVKNKQLIVNPQQLLYKPLWQSAYGVAAPRVGFELKPAFIFWGPFQFSESVIERVVHSNGSALLVNEMPLSLRTDPYGLPYHIRDGKFVSIGLERHTFEHKVMNHNFSLETLAKQRNRWPADLEEAMAWLQISEDFIYEQAELIWENNRLEVDWRDKEKIRPWPLHEWAQFWLSLQQTAP